ncbi:hypothetical protein LX36DRAFT_633052 [Colletotrichum falcatum]|nr:hypothetical protein LX36DRAFT_633052 [Colletotrichum falcatum]
MIYEHCGPELLPSRKWLHVRLSPAAKPGDKRWWTCDVCGREGSVCHCLRPALHAIHPALLDEVHDLVLRRNAVHPEPAAWYDLAKLHDPGRRRSMRVPGELQALWAQFMAGLRRVGVSVQWNPVYLEAVSRALSQSAPLLKELTLFMSRQQGKAAERAAYDQFLGRLSGIRSLEVIRIVGIPRWRSWPGVPSSQSATAAARKCRCPEDPVLMTGDIFSGRVVRALFETCCWMTGT